jgi:hypothetical protein
VPFAGGPPVWWNTIDGSLPALNDRLDDPRWRGCTRHGFDGPWASAQGEEAGFRALSNAEAPGSALYLSWTVKADNVQDDNADAVVVGFESPDGTARQLRLEAFPFQAGGTAFRNLASARLFTLGTPGSVVAPAWVTDRGRVFAAGDEWTIQLHVPVRSGGPVIDGAGIQLASTFRFYFSIRVRLGAAATYTLTYPPNVNENDPTTWDNATIGGGGCGDVVSIVGGSVRTTNNPAHRIRYLAQNAPGPAPTNVLVADLQNNSGNALGTNAVRTRFFIANWGSIPNQPNMAASLWQPIPAPAGGPGGNPNPINDGTAGQVQQSWVVQDPLLAGFRSGDRWSHQCILCELSGGGITFSPASTSSNFELVAASTFRRDALISVRGLPDPGTPERDVYLLVSTTNMPAQVDQRPPPRDAKPPSIVAVDEGDGDGGGHGDGDGDGDGRFDPSATDFSGFDLLRRDEPTYVVHVFHDSGLKEADSGLPILVPQTPFGFAVSHDGELHGWEHALTGATLTQVGPNLYRLRVRTDGEAVVTTSITAREHPRSWWRWLLRCLIRLIRRLIAWLRKLLGR